MIEHFLNAVGASQPPERYGESFGTAKGNTAGGLLADSRSLVKGEGLRIATRARPPRLTRGAAGVSLWARLRSWQGGPPGPLAGRVKSLGAKSPSHVPAHPPVSLAEAGTYLPCWV